MEYKTASQMFSSGRTRKDLLFQFRPVKLQINCDWYSRGMRDESPDPSQVAPPSPRRANTVQSVEVAVLILEGIADNNGLVRVNELARQLQMTKARVSRHLQTLLALGLVAKGQHEGYTFGSTLQKLGRAAVRDRNLVDLAKPHLQRLRDETGHTVILGLPAPDGVVVISCVEGQDNEAVSIRVSGFLPAPGSPAARLAVALQRGASRYNAGLLKHWPAFGAEYELDTGRGVGGVAAPVLGEKHELVAVVSVVAPSGALRPEPGSALVNALARCVRAIEVDTLH